MYSLIIHISNEEPFLAEVEELPDPNDQILYCSNPRRRDGRELHYLQPEVQRIIVPWHRVTFIEILPSGEEEEIVSPFAD